MIDGSARISGCSARTNVPLGNCTGRRNCSIRGDLILTGARSDRSKQVDLGVGGQHPVGEKVVIEPWAHGWSAGLLCRRTCFRPGARPRCLRGKPPSAAWRRRPRSRRWARWLVRPCRGRARARSRPRPPRCRSCRTWRPGDHVDAAATDVGLDAVGRGRELHDLELPAAARIKTGESEGRR